MPRGYPGGLFGRLLANSVESEDWFYEGTPCWCWIGTSRCRRGEYPRLNVYVPQSTMPGLVDGQLGLLVIPGRPRTVQAHRAMAELVLGRKLDPDIETLDHGCTLTLCINPWHFRIATRVDNSIDSQRRRRGQPRVDMRPLLDPALWSGRDALVRCLPILRSTLTAECPF